MGIVYFALFMILFSGLLSLSDSWSISFDKVSVLAHDKMPKVEEHRNAAKYCLNTERKKYQRGVTDSKVYTDSFLYHETPASRVDSNVRRWLQDIDDVTQTGTTCHRNKGKGLLYRLRL